MFEKCTAKTEEEQITFLIDLKSLIEYKPDNDFFIKACMENLLYSYGFSIKAISQLTGIDEKNILLVLNDQFILSFEEKYNLACSIFRLINLILSTKNIN